MTDAPKIFKEEDCFDGYLYLSDQPADSKHVELGPPWIKGDYIELKEAQRIFQKWHDETLTTGYIRRWAENNTSMVWDGISDEQDGAGCPDSHVIYYYTQPLEQEEPECEHTFGTATNTGQDQWVHYSFCPLCGVAL